MTNRSTNAVSHRNVLGKGRRALGVVLGIVTTCLLLGTWLIVSGNGWIEPRFLPSPWRVVTASLDIRPNIFVHAAYTTSLIIGGFVTGTSMAFIVGLCLRHSFLFRSIMTPLIESARPVPPVAVVPFFLIWFGFSLWGKIVLISLGTFLIVVIGVVEAIDRLPPIYLRSALSFGASNWQFLRFAALPGIMPSMIAPLRIALATAITLSVVSEFMGATRGLGHVLNVALNTFATHTVLLCAVILGLIGGAMDGLLRLSHRWIVRWAQSADEALQ